MRRRTDLGEDMLRATGKNWQAGALCAMAIAAAPWLQDAAAAAARMPAPPVFKHQKAPVPVSADDLEDRSRAFVTDYFEALSSDTQSALMFIREHYGARVSYFGKWLDADSIAERRAKLFERWPQRSYRVSPKSLQIICNRVTLRCRVQTIVDWKLANPDRDWDASGVERNVLELAFDSGQPRIVFEGAELLSR